MSFTAVPMRFVPLLALCLALPLAAQTPDPTPPEAYYPLTVGDVREYKTTVIWPASPPSYLRESVVDDMQVDGQTYYLVDAVEYNVSGDETSRQTRVIRFDSVLAVPVERGANGAENPITPCRLDLPFGPPGSNPDCPFYSGSPSETVFGVQTPVKTFVNMIGDVRYAAGFGFVSSDIEEGNQVETRLRYARIGGVTYGQPDSILPPLAPEPSAYWPLDVGNTWVNRYEGPYPHYEWKTVTGTTVVADTSYALVEECRRYDGEPTSCVTARIRVDDLTGRIVRRYSNGEAPVMCGLLPTATPGPIMCGISGVDQWTLEVDEPGSVQIGGQTVATPSIRSVWIYDLTLSYAAGFGPLPSSGLWSAGALVYARIGGVEYGLNPVSIDAPPLSATLAVAVAPTPTSGAATLTLALPAPARVTVEAFDALGRRVLATETDASAGEIRLDVDARGWAPGLYLVRATTDDGASATTRLVRH